MGKRKNKKQEKVIVKLVTLLFIILAVAVWDGLNNTEIINSINNFLGIEALSESEEEEGIATEKTASYSAIGDVPEYSGEAYVEINNNIPYFDESEYTTKSFENYSQLDSLGRCGVAYANVCKEIMPADGEKRESISSVKPTGWVQAKYDGEYLYNRCHLIGYQLADENANELNLITGTRYFNVTGMLPFENEVADYIKANSSNHVLYRVTPIYEGDNLLATRS
jgi:DNA-entry nuclease